MKKQGIFSKKYWQGVVVIGIILGLMVTATIASAQNLNPRVLPPDATVLGKTLGEWSAEWWKWALSIPADDNPLLDETGEKCGIDQSGGVWFLAGTFGGTVERTCTIPAGKYILFPIINAECSTVEGNGTTEEELLSCANDLISHVTEVEATVDGRDLRGLMDSEGPLEKYRVESPLFIFDLPQDNILVCPPDWEQCPEGPSASVADGYWILLAPLPVGDHTVEFRGVADFPFETGVIYHLTVKKRP